MWRVYIDINLAPGGGENNVQLPCYNSAFHHHLPSVKRVKFIDKHMVSARDLSDTDELWKSVSPTCTASHSHFSCFGNVRPKT